MSKRIQVTSSDIAFVLAAKQALRTAGYSLVEAPSISDAEAARQDQAIDLKVIDAGGLCGQEMDTAIRSIGLAGPCLLVLHDATAESGFAALIQQPCVLGCLIQPVSTAQLLASVAVALRRAEDLQALRETSSDLKEALAKRRTVSMAVGLIMERYHTDQGQAFELLREKARSDRRKLTDTADELLHAFNALTLPDPNDISHRERHPKKRVGDAE